MYTIIYSTKAEEDLRKLKKSEPIAFQKAVRLHQAESYDNEKN